MIAVNSLLLVVMLAAPPSPLPASPSACAGVLDRTRDCPAPDDVTTSILEDPKPDAEKQATSVDGAGFPIDKMPNELAFASTIMLLVGGGALAASYASTPADEDAKLIRDVSFGAGIGLLVWSGMAATGALALYVFNPATGEMRLKLFGENE